MNILDNKKISITMIYFDWTYQYIVARLTDPVGLFRQKLVNQARSLATFSFNKYKNSSFLFVNDPRWPPRKTPRR